MNRDPFLIAGGVLFAIGVGMTLITGSDRWYGTMVVAGPLVGVSGYRLWANRGGAADEYRRWREETGEDAGRPRLVGFGTMVVALLATLVGLASLLQ